MSTGTRINLAEAERLAGAALALVAPVCEQFILVGSIRREQPTVGDLELLVEPYTQPTLDLFGTPTGEAVSALDAHVDALLAEGAFALRLDVNGKPRCGTRYKALLYRDVPVDLFACLPPAQWGVLKAIRTGPAAWSERLVTTRQKGGYLPDWLQVSGGALRRRDDGSILPTPTEEDVFALLGLDYVAPGLRR